MYSFIFHLDFRLDYLDRISNLYIFLAFQKVEIPNQQTHYHHPDQIEYRVVGGLDIPKSLQFSLMGLPHSVLTM
jgi:hypothetical protein